MFAPERCWKVQGLEQIYFNLRRKTDRLESQIRCLASLINFRYKKNSCIGPNVCTYTKIMSSLQGRVQDFYGGGGGVRKRLCARIYTHITSAKPNSLSAGVQGPLKGPGSSRVVLMVSRAFWASFLSILINKKKWILIPKKNGFKKHS